MSSIQQRWAEAQQSPWDKRYRVEYSLMNEMLASLPLQQRQQIAALGGSMGTALAQLCEHGNPQGWAFAHGFTVNWFPTKGAAKHAWYRDLAWQRSQIGQQPALGPKPEPCTLLDALIWGRGSC
jgi:hypothetical protein